ncbi:MULTISPECIES: hypothetical protein [unclassified Bacillus (in: firmicutes)]|uniref:hypothetical protein n=1 Tax=unclassified Bacillus (in: firmicutes) TaxID=185979 RepID=UPI001596D2BD|nr:MULTISPECIES: hypothetical protein [unclassified Bacillus (in: firmicutes)]
MKRKLLMIGNGMAGVRCLEEILKRNKNLFEITIIGDTRKPLSCCRMTHIISV